MRWNVLTIVAVFFSVFWVSVCRVQAVSIDKPFNNPSNWAGTGLMEIPTARVLDDGELRFGVAQAHPFRWYSGAMGVYPGLEVDFRFTELLNIESNSPGSYGNYKDKALDVKYQIFQESKVFPALAVGLHDIQGTQLFPAKYMVFSRQIFPLDFTLGFGTQRLKGDHSLPLTDKVGMFGGVEFALNDWFHLMAEYNPIDYRKDKGAVGRSVKKAYGQDAEDISPFNLGARFKIRDSFQVGLSYQRGDTLGMMAHIQVPLGQSVVPKRPDHPPLAPVNTRPFAERNPQNIVDQLRRAVSRNGYYGVRVYNDQRDLRIEFENTRYLSDAKAMGRILRIALLYAPEDTADLVVISKRRGMHTLELRASRAIVDAFFEDQITLDVFVDQIQIRLANPARKQKKDPTAASQPFAERDLFVGFKPDFEPYLNDLAGFFKFRISVKPYVRYFPWKGGILYARYMLPLYSNVSTAVGPAPEDAVRSDLVDYRGTDPTFDRLLMDQMGHFSRYTYWRVSMGYFEDMYAGIGGEVLRFFGDGRLALGIEADWVRKREPGSMAFESLEAHSILANLFYAVPKLDILTRFQYGRFLAEDDGLRISVSREYDTGAIIGAWYSITDTSDFTNYNRNYHDKGVFVSLPFEMFSRTSDPRRYQYSASPWTRDVAQTVAHPYELYGTHIGVMPFSIRDNIRDFKK